MVRIVSVPVCWFLGIAAFCQMLEEGEYMGGGFPKTKGEQVGLAITAEDVEEARQKGRNCLVGGLLTDKKVNKEAFKNVLSRIWRVDGYVAFKEIQDNLWIIEFSDEKVKKRVMAGRPWSFDRHILVLKDFDGRVPPTRMDFMQSTFWIQVHDMPLICMFRAVGKKIGESLGHFEEVDVDDDGAGWGRSLRIRVTLGLTKPLEYGRELLIGGDSIWVSFKYEQLPLFCFHCGRIIHKTKGCMVN